MCHYLKYQRCVGKGWPYVVGSVKFPIPMNFCRLYIEIQWQQKNYFNYDDRGKTIRKAKTNYKRFFDDLFSLKYFVSVCKKQKSFDPMFQPKYYSLLVYRKEFFSWWTADKSLCWLLGSLVFWLTTNIFVKYSWKDGLIVAQYHYLSSTLITKKYCITLLFA